jgi:mycoredoxin
MSNGAVMIYSTPWCGPCRRLKDQLDRLDVAYAVVDIERDPSAAQLVEQINNGLQVVPTVVVPDGSVLTNPSGAQVKDRLCNPTASG